LILAATDVLTTDSARWRVLLQRLPHDIYHTPEYHSVPGFGQTGEPLLFVYTEGEHLFLWPYLRTPIAQTGLCDVRSAYGYPGPLACGDQAFAGRAWQALVDHWRSQRAVSAFTRFHPLLGNCRLLDSVAPAAAGVRAFGATVSIDLTAPAEAQLRHYNKKLRQEIRKAREAGFTTVEDETWQQTDAFVALYRQTMARRGSLPEYVIDRSWVNRFRQILGPHLRLFVTRSRHDTVAAAMIVLSYPPFIHCHLLGSAPAYAGNSPAKLLLDDVRLWGTRNGYATMHLGGGLGGREDSLFLFKRRFSPNTHAFHTGAWVLDAPRYQELEAAHRARLDAKGTPVGDIPFFPAYRYQPPAAAVPAQR